jgi:hypothetical protein
MLLSHRFGSVETLSRARHWLTSLGFEVAPSYSESHDDCRLSLNVKFSEASAALLLIDSIEGSDPEGWPGFMTRSKTIHHHADHSLQTHFEHGPTCTPIHWQKSDEAIPADQVSRKVSEYMLSRWE